MTAPNNSMTSSGFLAQQELKIGIVTTLHGVSQCKNGNLSAKKGDALGKNDLPVTSLVISKVDIAGDLAFLTSAQLTERNYLRQHDNFVTELNNGIRSKLRVVGYPESLEIQFGLFVNPQDNALVPLRYLLPGEDLDAFVSRKSPDVDRIVLSLSGPIQPGLSGAPILNSQGEIVAVADGGLGLGSDIGWAIPYSQIHWTEASSSNFAALSQDTKLLTSDSRRVPPPSLDFAAVPANKPANRPTTMPVYAAGYTAYKPTLYFADANESPGIIGKLQSGVVTEIYRRPGNRLYSIAVAPDGTIFFCDANEFHIYKLQGGREQVVYTHTTYVRSLAFDSHGTLYFSESSGAGGDGKVYRLTDAVATPYFTVPLVEIDGYWAGDFAFDKQGTLWLSSGNRRPSNLYKVLSGKITAVLASADPDSLQGITFASDGSLLYVKGGNAIYRLALPSFEPQMLYQYPGNVRLTGIALLPQPSG